MGMQVSCSDRPKIHGSDEELCWVKLLGEGIVRVDSGRDEAQVRQDIREQEKEDGRLDQQKMFE